MKTTIASPAFAGTFLIAISLPLSAATLMGTRTTVGPSAPAFNLTTIGTSDWAYWETAANPATGTPTDEKSGATIVSSMIAIGGGSVRGSSSATRPNASFSWMDGANVAMGSQTRATGLFNSDIDTGNRGVGMTITIPTTETYQITVWTYNFGGAGTFSASLPGATTYSNTTASSLNSDPKASYFYTLTVTPDAVNGTANVLSLQNLLVTDDTGRSNTNVGISGVAVSVVPEPSSVFLVSLASMTLLGFRRR